MQPIRNKRQMYRELAAGTFGNTVPQWFDRDAWRLEAQPLPLWGIRSQLAGGCVKMRLNVPRDEVYDLFGEWFPDGGGNISPMIDMYAVIRGEVINTQFSSTPGLNVFYVPPEGTVRDGKTVVIDPKDPWRGSFRNFGVRGGPAEAWFILRTALWPDDFENMIRLVDEYPEHTIEFSACNRAVGTVPNRNTIIWEVRRY